MENKLETRPEGSEKLGSQDDNSSTLELYHRDKSQEERILRQEELLRLQQEKIKSYKRSVTKLSSLSKEDVKHFLDSVDTIVTDCDGVLWVSGHAIPGSPEVLNRLRELGKRIFFVTNNSTKTRDELVTGARNLQYVIDKDEIISTSYLVATYLKNINFQGKVYIVGSEGIAQELDLVHIKHTGVGPEEVSTLEEALDFVIDPQIKAVIVGMDKHISYRKMVKAATYINNPEVLFLGTNLDERFPMDGSKVLPGSGALVKAIECCSLREATIIGKPSNFVGKALVQEHGIDPERTIMIGDRCNTDIAFGTRCGFKTLLVLSGITSEKEAFQYKKSDREEDKELVPDVYLDTLGSLLPFLSD